MVDFKLFATELIPNNCYIIAHRVDFIPTMSIRSDEVNSLKD